MDLSALIGASADEKVRKRDGKQPKGKQKETERYEKLEGPRYKRSFISEFAGYVLLLAR